MRYDSPAENIMGLWIVQECRRQWQRDGLELSYGEITEMAQAAQPFAAFIDPNAGDFFAPGDMPNRVNTYLKQNGQPTFEDKGQLMRVVLEGWPCVIAGPWKIGAGDRS